MPGSKLSPHFALLLIIAVLIPCRLYKVPIESGTLYLYLILPVVRSSAPPFPGLYPLWLDGNLASTQKSTFESKSLTYYLVVRVHHDDLSQALQRGVTVTASGSSSSHRTTEQNSGASSA